MSRDDGFAIADVDSGLLEDGKLKTLWQTLRDEERMTRAVTLYVAVLLSSWRHGRRVQLCEAVPAWLTLDAELVTALRRVRLLDRQDRICLRAWHGWYDPAYERRENRRKSGRLGGLKAAGKPRKAPLTAAPKRRSSVATPDRPKDGIDVAIPSPRGGALGSAAAPREEPMSSEDARQALRRRGVLRVVDRGGLLAEPMPVAASAALAVEDEP